MSAVRVVLGAVALIARANTRGFVLAGALQVLGAVAAIAVVFAGKAALQSVIAGGTSLAHLLPTLVVLAVASAVSNAVSTVQLQQQRLLGEDIATVSWQRLLEVGGRVDLEVIDSPDFADRLERIEVNALDRPAQLATAVLGLIGSLLSLVALTAAVLGLQPILIPILLVAGVPTVLLSQQASRSEFTFARRWSELARMRLYSRRLLTDREYAAEVRSGQLEGELLTRHRQLSRQFRRALREQVRRRQVLVAISTLVSAAALGGALAVIALLVHRHAMTLAEAGAGVIAVRLLSGQLDRFFATVGSVVEAGPFLADLDAFVRTARVQASSEQAPWPVGSGLALHAVRYRYPGTDRDVLRGIDLQVRPGEVVALVGENGSGKTTLAKIAAGLYAPSAGQVQWNGGTVDDDARPQLRRSTSVIFQDFVRFDLPAADNIDLAGGRWGRDRAAVESAAEQARIAAEIRRLPRGFDTMLGRAFEGGHDLSGGQWQRVALARALVRRTPVVILDEPTSGLDPRAERDLVDDVRARLADRAVVLVSHRYANLHLVDRIYVLQEGLVVESGTHPELVARRGLYHELYRLQSTAYRTT